MFTWSTKIAPSGEHSRYMSCFEKACLISEVCCFREEGFIPAQNILGCSQLDPLFIVSDKAMEDVVLARTETQTCFKLPIE